MFDHIGLKATNMAASLGFYDAALKPLGYLRCYDGDGLAGYGPGDQPMLWLHANDRAGPGTHVALTAPDHAAVHGFHAAGLRAQGRDNGGPGPRPDYGPTYYAAFLLDPDGNNIEAVCMGAAG